MTVTTLCPGGKERMRRLMEIVRRGRVELHAENPRYEPIVPDPRELRVLGKVVEVRRVLE